jgi:EEF1A lysine methyltransferase 1
MSNTDSPVSSAGSSPRLNADTLALLNSFLSSKAETEERLNALITSQNDQHSGSDKPMMSVEEYRKIFTEDWQLSQFW